MCALCTWKKSSWCIDACAQARKHMLQSGGHDHAHAAAHTLLDARLLRSLRMRPVVLVCLDSLTVNRRL